MEQAGGPLLVSCPQLLIQYICGYPLYLEVISSVQSTIQKCTMLWWQGTHFH